MGGWAAAARVPWAVPEIAGALFKGLVVAAAPPAAQASAAARAAEALAAEAAHGVAVVVAREVEAAVAEEVEEAVVAGAEGERLESEIGDQRLGDTDITGINVWHRSS